MHFQCIPVPIDSLHRFSSLLQVPCCPVPVDISVTRVPFYIAAAHRPALAASVNGGAAAVFCVAFTLWQIFIRVR